MTFEEKLQKCKEFHDKIQQVTMLEAQTQALSEQSDFYEECLVEMAMMVYGGAE